MSIQLEVVKNQPLGWSKVSEPECEDCREGDYCSPLAFIQDGANWVSDVVSFQGRYLGEVEGECNLLPEMEEATIDLGPIGTGEPSYEFRSMGLQIDFNGGDGADQFILFYPVAAPNCNYAASVVVESQSGTVSGNVSINGVDLPVAPGLSYSSIISFQGSPSLNEISISAPTGIIVRLTFLSITGTCKLAPQRIEFDTFPYGTIETLVDELKEVGDYIYQALNYRYVLSNDEYNTIKGKCMFLTLASGCCCPDLVQSRCVRITEPTCDTLQFVYSQPFDGFGFAYPSGFNHYIRLIAIIRDPYFVDEGFETYTDSAGRKNVIYSEPREAQVLSYTAPDYVHSAMALALRHDNFRLVTSSGSTFYALVDGEEYRPNWGIERKIAKVVVELEIKQQQLWSKRCN